jgi:hypothetical protein
MDTLGMMEEMGGAKDVQREPLASGLSSDVH